MRRVIKGYTYEDLLKNNTKSGFAKPSGRTLKKRKARRKMQTKSRRLNRR